MDYKLIYDLETVRELLNLTLQELAQGIGVSRATLNNWLAGKVEADSANISSFYEFAFRKGVRLNRIKEQFYREELENESGKILFHGAKTEITGPLSLVYSRKNNDFGQGFYCGENLEQSAMFVSNFSDSSLYMLRFDKSGLKSRSFGVERDWMLMIAYYRNRLGDFANTEIIRNLLRKNRGVDYIIAPIADNRMFEIIDQFIDGEITDIQCKHCLSATNLGMQYVFLTNKALSQVYVLEHCYLAESEKKYYLNSRKESLRVNNDKVRLARKQYRNQGQYIEDILK